MSEKKLDRRCAGFTMTEMAVALAIAAILLAIGVPGFRDLIASQRVRHAATDLHADLAFARAEAVKRNASVQIVRQAAAWTEGWSVRLGGTTLRTHAAIAGVSYAGTPEGSVTYNADGRVTLAGNMTFNFSAPSGAAVSMRCVVITPSGHPSLLTDSNRNGNCQDG